METLRFLFYYLQIGGLGSLQLFFFFMIGYFGLRILKDMWDRFAAKSVETLEVTKRILTFFVSINLVLLAFLIIAQFLIWGVTNHGDAIPEQVIRNNAAYLEWDRRVFGVYVPFWFQSSTNTFRSLFDTLTPLIIGSFNILSYLISGTFMVLLIRSARNFFKMLIAFMIPVLLCVPLWYVRPSLSPMQGMYDNVLSAEISQDVQQSIDTYAPNELVTRFVDDVREYQTRADGSRRLFYTTMPSMHVAWSIVILYFGFQISQYIGAWLIPYTFFNALGTAFTLQHYMIDAPAGMIIGVITVYLVRKYVTVTPRFIKDMTEILQEDIESVRAVVSVSR